MLQLETKFTGNLEAALDRLTSAAGESALRSACVAGATVFREEAKRRVPVDTGVLRDNIIMKRADERSDGGKTQTYLVTVRTGKQNQDGDAFYWRFVENGHNIVRRRKANESFKAARAASRLEFGTSKVAARPFIRPAYEAKKREAVDAMRKRLGEKISEFLGETK